MQIQIHYCRYKIPSGQVVLQPATGKACNPVQPVSCL